MKKRTKYKIILVTMIVLIITSIFLFHSGYDSGFYIVSAVASFQLGMLRGFTEDV